MRYLVEENIKGRYMIRYKVLKDLSEEDLPLLEEVVAVDILRVWQPTYLTHVKTEDIEDEFGTTLGALKSMIGDCLTKAKYPSGQWIRVDILNVM